jgi:antitoxin (DNA-binding transcriptional repressor) of toxin-antitoxin stability system
MWTHVATLRLMETVGLRELKNRLSEVVRRVRAGEEVLVTDRGQVVAELRQPAPPGARAELHPGLAALARRGALTLGAPNDPELYPSLAPLAPAGAAARLLDEERGER